MSDLNFSRFEHCFACGASRGFVAPRPHADGQHEWRRCEDCGTYRALPAYIHARPSEATIWIS